MVDFQCFTLDYPPNFRYIVMYACYRYILKIRAGGGTADTLALGASAARREGSNPSLPTRRYRGYGGSTSIREVEPPSQDIMIKIIFQNEDFIIVDKPNGLAVHRGVKTSERTLVDFLVENFPEIKNVGDDKINRPGIVHRLDKETSGVMIVARNQKSFEYFKNLFKNRQVEKKYIAVVHGKLPAKGGSASGGKNKTGKNEGEMGRSKKDFRKQALVRGKILVRKGRYSLTHYKVLEEFDNYSLLEVSPKTGRMHQIRVHLHSIGHPIVGDKKYTFKKFLLHRQAGEKNLASRMFLHAESLKFFGPKGEKYFFAGKLPEEFESFR